jgi:serine/threonine-protein kinase
VATTTVAGQAVAGQATNVMDARQLTTPGPGPTTIGGSSKSIWLAVAAVVLIAALAGGYWLLNRGDAPSANARVSDDSPSAVLKAPEGLIAIPGGNYMMGRNLSDEEKNFALGAPGRQIKIFSYDYPAHETTVSPFFLDRTEVSNAQYAEFVKATNRQAPADWNGNAPPANADLIPVTGVTYQDAIDYCSWRSGQRADGFNYRLPTEEEWEYAARGQDAGKPGAPINLYPWGDQWLDGEANTKEARLDHPRNVDSYPNGKSPFGILNMAGNVAEWTATDFNHYPGSDQQTPREAGYQGTYQVVRGGAFFYPKEFAMTTTRVWARPEDKGPRLGFRCAADLKK